MVTEIDRQFTRAHISMKDMEQCIAFAEKICDESDPTIQRALIVAAIISYARPFSGNERHEYAVSTPQIKPLGLTAAEKKLHDKICEIRNTAVAHSDFQLNPRKPVKYGENGFVVAGVEYDPLKELPKIPELLALARKVEGGLSKRLMDLSREAALSGK